MNTFKTLLAVFAIVLLPFASLANNGKTAEQLLEGADAIQAMEYANQWKWTQNDIMSHVTPQEIVFEFPSGKIKKIPLPEDKMVVAIAPYLTYTHG